MLNETFRYAVANWIISSEEEETFHLIKQEEINFLLEKIIFLIENNENNENIINWKIKEKEKDTPKKISKDIISYLKKVAFTEMKNLIQKEMKNNIPKGFLKDNLYYSKLHISGF